MVTKEGCHWERKVTLLLVSVFHRDQPGSEMVRARVTKLLCAALGGRAGVETWKTDPGQRGQPFRSGDQADAQWGKNKPRTVQRHKRHSHGTLRHPWGRILRRLYIDKKDDETAEFMTSFTLTS